jgi:hypothetical protein
VNRDQRLALVIALAIALWGVGHALLPFEVEVAFGLTGGCSSPVAALSDDEPPTRNPFVGEIDDDDLQSCADVAGRRLVTGVITIVLAAVGGYAAYRLLGDREADAVDDVADSAESDRPPLARDGVVPLGDELPPYAS